MQRTHIEIRGARENNLRNVSLDIPRDALTVVTGVSGSGKSSLAFETLYAEGQRRLMASMSAFAKRFVSQLKKPDVDFVNGLSPVISIDQKTIATNPRSTIGTMTDISDYLRMLFATMGSPHCPACGEALSVLTPHQMMEHLYTLPRGTTVEVRAPVAKIYGEDYEYLFEQIRIKGYRQVRIDDVLHDVGEEIELDESRSHSIVVVVDDFSIEDGLEKSVVTSLEHSLEVGDGLLSFHVDPNSLPKARRASTLRAFYEGFGCPEHHVLSSALHPGQFTFNDPSGACVTCAGIGTSMRVYTPLLVPDPSRSLRDGAIVKEAFNCDKNTGEGRMLYSLSLTYGFSLDVPYRELSEQTIDLLMNGSRGEKITLRVPEGARQGHQHEGKEVTFRGIVAQLEHAYRWWRKQGTSHAGLENYLKKVMVEYPCPDCDGTRLKEVRRLVTVSDRNLHQVGELHLRQLLEFLQGVTPAERYASAASQIIEEVSGRLQLLIGIGLDYLNLNRRSSTLSGGEAQRIRLSSQIGSGLMGMLYVLDEPSIGLHPKDNVKMIETLRRLRDLGNTVIVVEHDEETMRAADHVVEIGPGPGVHGGTIVAQGSVEEICQHNDSVTGQFLSGRREIPIPKTRRSPGGADGNQFLTISGARENNLKNVSVRIPLRTLTCITGASGSGKSSLVHRVLFQKLSSILYDSRIRSGEHDAFEGAEFVDDVIHIDQSPIGRSPRSNPATYIGFYDNIRKLFAATEESQKRDYTPSRFSFNVKGGRCEECSGEGTITTQLSFMPDVEVTCPTCKGLRYNQETLEVTYDDKNISEVLDLSVEEGVSFFADQRAIARKIEVLNELGLGYLKLGHAATILSGGEAQRIKLAAELGKLKRGKHNLYILDEPTTGLHFADIQRLLDCLQKLVEQGHSVIVIEHNIDVVKSADYVIDLGPEGGHKGGEILAWGTPEEVAANPRSHTGRYLAEALSIEIAANRRGANSTPQKSKRKSSSGGETPRKKARAKARKQP